jgi:uncharacterized membrane protein YjjP (DUF1212 family)
MDMIEVVYVKMNGIIVVIMSDVVKDEKSGIDLYCVFEVRKFVKYVMKMKYEMKERFNYVERVLEYKKDINEEEDDKIEKRRVNKKWKWCGKIVMENVKMR